MLLFRFYAIELTEYFNWVFKWNWLIDKLINQSGYEPLSSGNFEATALSSREESSKWKLTVIVKKLITQNATECGAFMALWSLSEIFPQQNYRFSSYYLSYALSGGVSTWTIQVFLVLDLSILL